MSAQPRPWLPPEAMRDGALTALLTEHAKGWAERWFREPKAVSLRMSASSGQLSTPNDSACWEASGLRLNMAAQAQRTIAGWMLDASIGGHRPTETDLRLFRDLAARCAEDFIRGVTGAFLVEPQVKRTSPGRHPEGGFLFSLTVGSATNVLELHAPDDLAIAARKGVVTTRPSSPRQLQTRDDGVARQTIRVGAMLGIGKVGLSELYALACGDVLVLDHGPSDELCLTVNGETKTGTGCELLQDGSAMKLRVASFERGGVQ